MRQSGLIYCLARCCDSSVYLKVCFKVTSSGSLPGANRKYSEVRIQERKGGPGREQKQPTESNSSAASHLGEEQSRAVASTAVL